MSTDPAAKVFFAVSMSLDGFIAPDGMDLEHGHDPTTRTGRASGRRSRTGRSTSSSSARTSSSATRARPARTTTGRATSSTAPA